MPAQAPLPTMAGANSSLGPESGDESADANRTALGKPAGTGRPAPDHLGHYRRSRLRGDGTGRLVPEPPDDGDPLFGARSRRYRSHRRRPARSGCAFRRQRREHGRLDAGGADGRGADDPRGKGAAAQRRRGQRTVRQARLARADIVYAGRHAPKGARRRARPDDPDDAHGQGGAGAYRSRRRRLLPPRASAILGVRGHPHRRRRRSRHWAGDPPPGRLRRSGNEAR